MSLKITNPWHWLNKRYKFSIVFKSTLINLALFTILFTLIGFGLVFIFSKVMFAGASLVLEDHERVVRDMLSHGEMDRLQMYADNTNISISVVKATERMYNSEVPSEIDDLIITNKFYAKANGQEYLITIKKSLDQEWHSVRFIVFILLFVFIIFGVFVLSISGLTTGNMVRPIRKMVRIIRAGDLNVRLDVTTSHDELRDLAETFNSLMDKIGDTYRQQDRFVSDASHELRTPLLVIQGYADLLERWGKEDTAVQQEAIDSIKKEASYMNKLVERLLFLARADQNRQKLELTTFDLFELLDEIIRDAIIMNTGHTFSLQHKQQIFLRGDASLIKQVIRIVLDNSIKYTPPPGEIKIQCDMVDENAVIIVEDSGAGISKEDLPRIFERFYKADKARSRTTGGTGLGLSIAQWIVHEHGGTITAQSLGKGTIVTIKLPMDAKKTKIIKARTVW